MKNIYLGVEKSIKELQSIFKNTDDKDEKLKQFNQEALKVFQQLEFKSLKELESLKNNEEWENFTIAFYGETGAGKSTLIECLRLFFKERSKMDQQERFRRLYSNYVKNHRGSGHALLELEKFQDGAIIGDGRSDFTLKTKSYTLKHNNKTFTLLDVPGIEGDEKKVIEQISNATQKAHAIFYVTKTPNPPQKGEEGKRGTIEKIQKQLGSQTEVWAIFNKPINNPRAFKDGLIDENEKESLKILNKKMKNILGKHYLVGGFSCGKTSIAAAWIDRLDESMKIDHRESSDEVKIYDIDNEIELVDTPGLFGFKEKITDSGKIERYKDITKKYISEAHLILYALNPSNPIKESHKDDLNWLFRTLNLLSRTIFVISRFDEEADIEDEEDYNKRFKIKKENIQNRLNDLISLSEEEKESLIIVAVAANPYDLGVEHWLKHQEEFQKLSHIKTLQDATQKKIKENGGKLTIIEEAKKSVIQDVVYRQMPPAKQALQDINGEMEYLNKTLEKRRKEIQDLNKEISQARIHLKEFIIRYFSDLIRQVSGTSLETFNDFVIRGIGDKGINIDTRVQNEFERQMQGIFNEMAKIGTTFNADMSFFEKHAGTLGKIGINFLNQSGLINATNIKLARDALVATGKFVGIDLALKFKPWGAVRLAGNLNKALPLIGIAFEAWDSYNKYQKEQEFEKAKGEMKSNFEEAKEQMIEFINDEAKFKQICFPNALELEKSFQEIEEKIKKTQECDQEFEKWIQTGEDFIEVEPKRGMN
ncbi:50S ribosome-binding GTPase [Helicobacter pylori]|nr:50S ribosome-binding GTPase [Helicobacter pylori]